MNGRVVSAATIVHRGTVVLPGVPTRPTTATEAVVNLVPEIDADTGSVKYRKRRSARDSPWHRGAGGLVVVLLTLALGAWHYGTPRDSRPHLSAQNEMGGIATARRNGVLSVQDPKLPSVLVSEEAGHREGRRLEEVFLTARATQGRQLNEVLTGWLDQLNSDILHNVAGGIRWVRPYLLPSLEQDDDTQSQRIRGNDHPQRSKFLSVRRSGSRMRWEDEWQEMQRSGRVSGPVVDYTNPTKYSYPDLPHDVPPATEYPPLRPLGDLMSAWNHDDDFEGIIHETLLHFNYSDPTERALAVRFRDAELPFKVYDIPEVTEAGRKWTVEYVDASFKDGRASGTAQESPNNFFAFYIPQHWNVLKLGPAPVRNNDWDFRRFEAHARYADAVHLDIDRPHFYWQSGVSREQRHRPKVEWGFIAKDLPSFGSTEENFFVFHPEEQKGIQCRFGERGTIAATHWDSGMNFVAMVSGAKRYILSPPRECPKQGLFTSPHSPLYRHSLLNFAHMKFLQDPNSGMSAEERAWLERASRIESIETVLKQGEGR